MTGEACPRTSAWMTAAVGGAVARAATSWGGRMLDGSAASGQAGGEIRLGARVGRCCCGCPGRDVGRHAKRPDACRPPARPTLGRVPVPQCRAGGWIRRRRGLRGATPMWPSRIERTRWADPSRRLPGPLAQCRSPLRTGRRSTPLRITTPLSGGETGSSTAKRGSKAARSSPPSRLRSPTPSARESEVIPFWWSATGSSPSPRSPGMLNSGATTSLPAMTTGISISSG